MQRDAGSSREPQSRSTMSQHVPMSPRARTAADIIIVYSIRPWESRRHCASPPLAVASSSWVKLCAVRVQCVVRACWTVSRLPDPPPSILRRCVCGRCWVRRPLPNQPTTLPLWTTGPAAARTLASDARRETCGCAATTAGVSQTSGSHS